MTDALDAIINGNDPVCIVGSVALVGEVRVKWALRTGAMLPAIDTRH
jgi:hypothetical protein